MANSINYARILNCLNCYFTKRLFNTSSNLERLRSEWRRNRAPSNTKLGTENITEVRKAYGGFKKWKAVTVKSGKYSLTSQNIDPEELQLVDIAHCSQAYEEKVITLHTYVIVDVNPLKDKINIEKLTLSDSTYIHIKELFESGKLYAKVTTKPGQVGLCDGYIVEGLELDNLVNKIKNYRSVLQ
ncbi:small ribosomal subunit protein eS8 [Hydra vulgaris]|uniref:small ribosomal subunit protein eS8 n=1 Tax=Hydra vulgaris TaxID=6087 RepID=UPI00019254A7|nr:40S ribosomal protein S8 [Hydra vulgaris]